MYCVYALIDVFYIGKGKMCNNRHNAHFNETVPNSQNRHKLFKINYLRSNGFDIPAEQIKDMIEE